MNEHPDRPRHNATIHSHVPAQRAVALQRHIAWFDAEADKPLTSRAAALLRLKLRQWRNELISLPPVFNPPPAP